MFQVTKTQWVAKAGQQSSSVTALIEVFLTGVIHSVMPSCAETTLRTKLPVEVTLKLIRLNCGVFNELIES
jgi:hypothetical protein